VSAIMPTYNAMPYLKEAIDSVLAQTFTDWELIIVDDGSTDETPALLAQYDDPRIRVFELGENGGPAKARNIALGFACGKYIAPCDSDDISVPERFATQVAYLESHREIHVVASQMKFFWGDETPQPRLLYPEDPTAIQRRFARGRMASPFGSAMIRSWCFDRFGLFREELRSAEDLEWFLRIRRSCNFRVLPDFLYLYRSGTTNVTFANWLAHARNEQYAIYRARKFGTSADGTVLSLDAFSRRWQTRLGLYTLGVLRFANFRLRMKFPGRKLR
ncbi:MAG: glycosyltransferase family 2 protein, partial [Thermomicrobiales bacterium]